MQSLTQATAPREYRGSVPIDGYVHKFRLEAREAEGAENRPQLDTTPTVSLGDCSASSCFLPSPWRASLPPEPTL